MNKPRCNQCNNCKKVLELEQDHKKYLESVPETSLSLAKNIIAGFRKADNETMPCVKDLDEEPEKDWQDFLDYDQAQEVLG